MEAVAQTITGLNSLYVCDKVTILGRTISVAEDPLCRAEPPHEVSEIGRCQIRTTGLVCATASMERSYVLQHITPYMCCVRLCAVDDERCVFALLSGILGDKAQNIIDRLRSMLACSLVRDAAGPSSAQSGRSMRCRREVIPLRSGGFAPTSPDRGDCLDAAVWRGYQRHDRHVGLRSRADYVLRLDQRFGGEQGEHGHRSAPQHITGRST